MLHREPTTTYIVYPSWARFSYRWENLWPLLSAPLRSGYLDPRPEYWRRLGYPEVPQPFKLIDGPAGGGIVRADFAPPDKWMPGLILSHEASIRRPVGYTAEVVQTIENVRYLEPNDGPLAGIPFAPSILKRKAKIYVCGVSAEHVEAAGCSVYWVVGFERAKNSHKGISDMPIWAEHFGLKAIRISELPESIRAETASWFVDPAYDHAWFGIESDNAGVGFHFAVVVYLAYHLRRVAGSRMFSMNLVADIEGKPNARHLWYRK